MIRLNIQLTEQQKRALAVKASALGLSESAIIRLALDEYLRKS